MATGPGDWADKPALHAETALPRIIAHRGGAGLRPENTLAAFAHSLALGVDGLEIDVRLSRDGHVIVYHDEALDPSHVRAEGGERLGGEAWPVRNLSLRELKMFDVGYPRNTRSASCVSAPGERIPTLAEVLEFLDDFHGDRLILVELKTDFHSASALDPEELTEAVLDVLGDRPMKGACLLMSFDWRCLTHAMQSVPSTACVFLTSPESTDTAPHSAPWFAGHAPGHYGGSAVQAIRALRGRLWGPHHSQLHPDSVSEARRAGLRLAAWTVNQPRHLMRMQAFGVDYLITDYPDVAHDQLRSGAPYREP